MDRLVLVPLENLEGYPGGHCEHTWVSPDGKTVYLSIDADPSANPPVPASVVVLEVKDIDWDMLWADVEIINTLTLAPPRRPAVFPPVREVDPSQPIAGWVLADFTQAHGPTFLPHSNYTYITQWTDQRIWVMNTQTHEFAATDFQNFGQVSRQTHGVNFNPSGTIGLGTGYFYDNDKIDVYEANKETGNLRHRGSIQLGDKFAHAAFTHYTVWLDNRYALTASMQLWPTSLTPPGAEIIGPSVWLLDVWEGTAKQIIDTAFSADEAGVFLSPSDLGVAGGKLYLAEEDSLDGSFGSLDGGSVSVFDISDIHEPKFIKRFKPGLDPVEGLPDDFTVAHGIGVTPGEDSVYVTSYVSHYIIKIDTMTDEVVKVFGPGDGLDVPHGGFIAGSTR
ncbi:YncE family protein [Nitrosococcus halophilus]|nr:hypothetical protein [Nitrosococcus halophilus]